LVIEKKNPYSFSQSTDFSVLSFGSLAAVVVKSSKNKETPAAMEENKVQRKDDRTLVTEELKVQDPLPSRGQPIQPVAAPVSSTGTRKATSATTPDAAISGDAESKQKAKTSRFAKDTGAKKGQQGVGERQFGASTPAGPVLLSDRVMEKDVVSLDPLFPASLTPHPRGFPEAMHRSEAPIRKSKFKAEMQAQKASTPVIAERSPQNSDHLAKSDTASLPPTSLIPLPRPFSPKCPSLFIVSREFFLWEFLVRRRQRRFTGRTKPRSKE